LLQPSNKPLILYLKVTSSSSMIVGLDALPLLAMQNSEIKQGYLNSFDLVLVLFLLTWGLILYFTRRDKIITAFVIVQLVSTLFVMTYFGLFRIYLDDRFQINISNYLYSVLLILFGSSYLLFYRRVIAEHSPPKWAMRVLFPFQYYPLLAFGLMLIDQIQIALKFNTIIVIGTFIWLNIITLITVEKKTHDTNIIPRHVAFTSCWLFSIGLFLLGLPALGIMQATDFSLYRSVMQSLFSGVLLSGLVYMKVKILEQKRVQTLIHLSNKTRFERRRREEQSKFFSMLTHEIRTPLSVMSYAASTTMTREELSKYVTRNIKEIDSIIERCEQAHELDQNYYQVEKKSIKLDELIKIAVEKSNPNDRVMLPDIPDVTMVTDATLVQVILHNLLDNALKYSQVNSYISVSIDSQSFKDIPGLCIVVSNQIGNFDLPDPEKIFEKYYRSPTAHAATGSGLGLYLVKYFVKLLNGYISYEPIQKEVRFKLWLPI
jgi:signal transduction histidine kinase